MKKKIKLLRKVIGAMPLFRIVYTIIYLTSRNIINENIYLVKIKFLNVLHAWYTTFWSGVYYMSKLNNERAKIISLNVQSCQLRYTLKITTS